MIVRVQMIEDACPSCHGPKVFMADVTPTGYTAGAEVDHAVICPTLLCKHGVRTSGPFRLQEPCQTCEDEQVAEFEAEVAEAEREEAS